MSIALFTVVDLETAGLAPPASIVEIGVTHVCYDPDSKQVEIGAPHSKLFKPREALTPENIAVHHLTPAMLAHHPHCTDEELRAGLIGEQRPAFLVAANAGFERQWITPEIVGVDLYGKAPFWICTVKGAARLYPEAESHSNQAMRYRLGLHLSEALAMPPHRAGPDSYVTAHILAHFLQNTRVRDLVQWTFEPRWMTTIRFGKWKGKRWAEVDADYLSWMLAQADMDADAKHWARAELERRSAA